MRKRTYYDILGVSRDATVQEISAAKNALAKVYHPDVNMKDNIDTTAYMQEILKAYRVLSDEEKRKKYDMKLSGRRERVFRTYTLTRPEEEKEEYPPFVNYWNAAYRLNEIVDESRGLLKKRYAAKALPSGILRMSFGAQESVPGLDESLQSLCVDAAGCMAVLKSARIPVEYWQLDAMNWVLVRWIRKQSADYRVLFSKYDFFIENNKTTAEKLKLKGRSRRFRSCLKRLLEYGV